MENLAQTSFDRTRAYWTPIMDSFFIDLMVDHMHRGNKIGHTFNKQAWAEMLTSFSEKFGFQYDTDFLKTRYTNLYKRFNDIKDLLDQSGFNWDDTRNMVVADDYDWETYIKGHPDARDYRNKVVVNFSGLCLIYAYTTADGRYSRSSHDVDFDDEAQELNIADEKEASIPPISNSLRAYWTPSMDNFYIDLLLNQVEGGNRISNKIVTESWNEISALFNAKFGSQFGKKAFKNRYKDLRHQYNELKILLESQSGFSWDESREMITAEDYVWDSYTKVYPDARLYKFKNVPNYYKLSLIYGDEVFNGGSSPIKDHVEFDNEDPVLLIDNSYSRNENWTPSMDRHLIDLMLDQVHRGRTIDPIFNKQPWIDIVAAFNARFGSNYEKYILSNRYKILRKLYDDMKNLLDVNDFSWDETRNTITACDNVWDSYIEEYPDVKSFRTKIWPSYNDLCVIYGNLNRDRKLNELDQDMNFNGYGMNRNIWDPPMDRYLIDLMLEQIRKGCMLDQKLNEQAWADIFVKFTANFGLNLQKYELKNRFEILRKTFSDMKNLLDQNGFVWDEMRQMIIADDDLWHAVIADNPSTQLYRSQTLPNYNDLFQIYGSAITSLGEHHSDHFKYDFENGFGVPVGQYDDNSSADSDIEGIDWTKTMDRFFVQLLLDQVFAGNKIDGTLNSQDWIKLLKLFNEKFGLNCDEYVMENRYISLKKQYDDITTILNEDGFVWDEFRQMIMADDYAWESYIEEHPDAAIYKDKTFENYNNLRHIFGNGIQNRRTEFEPITKEEMEMEEMFENLDYSPTNIEMHNQTKKRRKVASLKLPSSRKTRRTNKESEEGKKVNYKSMEKIVDALEDVPDMDDELFLDACNLLEDERKAKAFVNMDIKQRRKWLLKKLRV